MSSLLYNDIVATVGNTPLIRLNRLSEGLPGTIYVKTEFFNPLASVKDRIGKAMIEAAEHDGRIKPGTVIVEGNRQGYSWAARPIAPTVFEIAVKKGSLTPFEMTKVLAEQ